MSQHITVALAGNPNSGKTTIYNALTGARQHVGNYPGVTVEKKESFLNHKGVNLKIIDLPGIYSLTAYSIEEVVTRNVIIDEKPDVIVDIIDSSNLERNLYLAVQLMELKVPVVLVFNMADMAKELGINIDIEKLSSLLGVSIVETVGSKGHGVSDILDEAIKVAEAGKADYPTVKYDAVIEKSITSIEGCLNEVSMPNFNKRWVAVKSLEGDEKVLEKLSGSKALDEVKKCAAEIESELGESPEVAIASARYGYINGACKETVTLENEAKCYTISESIDSIVVNRFLGIPIFLGLMYIVFQLTFTIGDPFMSWIEEFFAYLGSNVGELISHEALQSLIADGIIGGVGGVIVFLPNIILLFIALSILEASGYMARAAFITDKLMHSIGLHGKSFIPFLVGFGCSVPAIMATRTLDNQRDRILTMLVVPFMSCGARLPIYLLIIPAFFPNNLGLVLWVVYVIGIIIAIIVAKILSMTVLKGESAPFVMELPPYRMPTIKGVFLQVVERSWLYLKKAGTIILVISIVMWALTYFPNYPEDKAAEFEQQITAIEASDKSSDIKEEEIAEIENMKAEAELEYSFAGRMGKAIEPILAPLGFDWKIGTALIGAFAAKEVLVSQLGIVYSVGEVDGEDETSDPLREKLQENYSPLIGFALMIFALLSAPCMATFAIVKRESNSWKWAFFQLAGMTFVAYIVTLIVYQVGKHFVS